MNGIEQHRKLLDEIAATLEGGESVSVSPLLRKATRLAALLQLRKYQALFQMHLNGFDRDQGFRDIHYPDDDESAQNCKSAFISDRTTPDGHVMGHAAAIVEELHERMLAHRETPEGIQTGTLDNEFALRTILQRLRNRLGLFVIDAERILQKSGSRVASSDVTDRRKIFIGHGRSADWKLLRDFLRDRLGLESTEFEREATAGMTITERLEAMLEEACFAFLVLTAEDSHGDGKLHARENVVHEVGLCQGRFGRRRAIVLIEDTCVEFSNISGLVQIRFSSGGLLAKSEEIRRILERERIILPAKTTG